MNKKKCKCGCGKLVKYDSRNKRWNTYIRGHATWNKGLSKSDPRVANNGKLHSIALGGTGKAITPFEKQCKTHGITTDAYNAMLAAQNGVCAICKNPEVRRTKGTLWRLSIDHCHTTGKIRGLLCGNCNQTIGLLKEQINTLREMINYLTKNK